MGERVSNPCSCCQGTSFERVFDFGDVPLSGVFRDTANAKLPGLRLAFQLCATCGLLRQDSARPPRDYSVVARPTARQFPRYGDELIAELGFRGVGGDDLVLEIGCNDGSFLERLRAAGFRRTLGIEPAQGLAGEARGRGFGVVGAYFADTVVRELLAEHGPVRAVVCRHTLEHVPDPLTFMRDIGACLDAAGGLALIEVPDGAVIPDEMNVQELWDEHLHYFAPGNLARLINVAGLQVQDLRIRPHLDTRNLVAWCGTASNGALALPLVDAQQYVQSWRQVEAVWTEYRGRLAAHLRVAPRPVYLIGASHPQCNFANYAGLAPFVDYFIDDDPDKVGRFPPVAGGRATVLSTAAFEASAHAGTVVQTGFGYSQWTARICGHAAAAGMHVVDPRAPEFLPISEVN